MTKYFFIFLMTAAATTTWAKQKAASPPAQTPRAPTSITSNDSGSSELRQLKIVEDSVKVVSVVPHPDFDISWLTLTFEVIYPNSCAKYLGLMKGRSKDRNLEKYQVIGDFRGAACGLGVGQTAVTQTIYVGNKGDKKTTVLQLNDMQFAFDGTSLKASK